MSESILADFVGRFMVNTHPDADLEPGRVLMNQSQLLLVAEDDRMKIPLEDVFDVNVGTVPSEISDFFGHPVTLGFTYLGDRHVAVITAEPEEIQDFTGSLFKAILDRTTAWVKHPARIGGRVTDSSPETASLLLGTRRLKFADLDEPIEIDLEDVTHFERAQRSVRGQTRSILRVRHMEGGSSVTTETLVENERKMSLLGRYLRLEYRELMEEVRDMDLGDGEMELLVALYSGGDDTDLARMLGESTNTITMRLNDLTEKGLITDAGSDTALTPRGRLLVGQEIEAVNH